MPRQARRVSFLIDSLWRLFDLSESSREVGELLWVQEMNDLGDCKLVLHVENLVRADQILAVRFEPGAPLDQLVISMHLCRFHVVWGQVHGSSLSKEALFR